MSNNPNITTPFAPHDESLSDAVNQHLDLIAEVRTMKAAVDQMSADLIDARAVTVTTQGDVLRALNAASFAAGKVVIIEKKIDALHVDIRKLLQRGANGHG